MSHLRNLSFFFFAFFLSQCSVSLGHSVSKSNSSFPCWIQWDSSTWYDLSPLSNIEIGGDFGIPGVSLYLNMCGVVTAPDCTDLGAMACGIEKTKYPFAYPLAYPDDRNQIHNWTLISAPYKTLGIQLTAYGMACAGGYYATNVQVFCDPTINVLSPSFLNVILQSSCSLTLQIAHQAGCPLAGPPGSSKPASDAGNSADCKSDKYIGIGITIGICICCVIIGILMCIKHYKELKKKDESMLTHLNGDGDGDGDRIQLQGVDNRS